MSILCVVVHILCVYTSQLLSGFFGTGLAFFGGQAGNLVV